MVLRRLAIPHRTRDAIQLGSSVSCTFVLTHHLRICPIGWVLDLAPEVAEAAAILCSRH